MNQDEHKIMVRRMAALIAVASVLIAVYVLRLIFLQLVNGESFKAQATNTTDYNFTVTAARGDIVDSPEGAAWLDQQLASRAAGGNGPGSRPMTPALRQSRIHRFQLAQGVTPDGRAGPLTLMLLNRATGVSEPRLRTGG